MEKRETSARKWHPKMRRKIARYPRPNKAFEWMFRCIKKRGLEDHQRGDYSALINSPVLKLKH